MIDERDPSEPEDEELEDVDLDLDLGEDDLGAGAGLGDSGIEPDVTVVIEGLSLYTNHGMSDAERELGQRLIFDVTMELGDVAATTTDRLEDTVDYAAVCEQVALAAQERSYATLERLCSAVADRLIDRFTAESVSVKATKPEPPIALPVEGVSVEVEKQA
jgi:dihydroneopterin aldolase